MSIKRNTLWNLIGTGAPFLLGAITIPFLVRNVGVEAFGILTLVWVLIGYFSLFDFGLGRALTQTVASKMRSKDASLSTVVSVGLLMVLGAGLVGGLLLAMLSYPMATQWLAVSPVLQSDVYVSLLIAAVGIPFTTMTSGLRGVLEAYEEFGAINILRVILGLANFGAPALTVWAVGPQLKWMVLGLVIARVVVAFAHYLLVVKKVAVRWVDLRKNKSEAGALVKFGSWMTLSNIISPLMVTGDRFVISSVVGAALVAYYTVPFEVLIRFLILPAALTGALFPRFASLLVESVTDARRMFVKSSLLIGVGMGVVCLVAGIGSWYGLKVWLGEDFANKSWALASIMALGIWFNSMAQVPFAIIQASGNARGTALIHLVEFIIYFPLLFAAVHLWGLTGGVAAWVARAVLDYILLSVLAERIFHDKLKAV